MKVLHILSRNFVLLVVPLVIIFGLTASAKAAEKQAEKQAGTQNAPVTI